MESSRNCEYIRSISKYNEFKGKIVELKAYEWTSCSPLSDETKVPVPINSTENYLITILVLNKTIHCARIDTKLNNF